MGEQTEGVGVALEAYEVVPLSGSQFFLETPAGTLAEKGGYGLFAGMAEGRVAEVMLGDILMGLGRNTLIWAVAGLAACLPIPFINAGQNVILYKNVPEKMQGRVFAVRNSLQFFTIPVGILLGGFLADYVFEPFMQTESGAAEIFRRIVGGGVGSGMALMFLCTGTLGSIFSFALYHQKDIQKFRQ